MNVMTVPIAPEKDAGLGKGRGSGERGRTEAGSAFEGAVKTVAREGGARGGETPAAEGAGEPATEGGAVPGRTGASETPARPAGRASREAVEAVLPEKMAETEKPEARAALQHTAEMLGLLAAAAERAGKAAEPAEGEGSARAEGEPTPRGGAAADGGEPAAAGNRIRLAVLRMETHFEPALGHPVLVEVEAARAGENAQGRLGPLAAIGDILDGAPDRCAAAAKVGKDSDEIRLRFDEALARLGEHPTAAGENRAARSRPRPGDEGARAVSPFVAVGGREAERGSATAAPAGLGGPAGAAGPIAQQVAARIVDAFPAGEGARAPQAERSQAGTELRMRAGGAALKTLTIQLQPEHLGTLDVSMRLVDGQLTLELAASQSDTARVLLEDRAGLKTLLEGAGFSLDDASITVVTRDSAAAPTGRNPEENGERGGGAPSDRGGREDGGSGRPPEDGRRQHPDRRLEQEAGERAPRRSSSVYL